MKLYDKKTFVIMTFDKKYILKGDRKSYPTLISVADEKDRHKPSVWGTKNSAEHFLKNGNFTNNTSYNRNNLMIVEAKYFLEV